MIVLYVYNTNIYAGDSTTMYAHFLNKYFFLFTN